MNLGTDFLQLDPREAPPRDLTGWLTLRLRTAIGQGRLRTGDRLPATRALAADLGVSRGVVVEAYRRLFEEGLVEGRGAAGTRVRPLAPGPPAERARPPAPVLPSRALPPLPGDPAVPSGVDAIDLSPGLPDLSAFPRTAWLRAERAVLAAATTVDLRYGDPRGHPRLRAELATWLARTRGVVVDPDGLLVVAGVAQALALLAQVLVARGTGPTAVEDPGSRGAREQLQHWGMATVPVGVDADGLRVHDLGGARVALVTPAHQFPTGVALSPKRRRALLAWAGAAPGERLVVEDDYDAEHRYDRAPVPALQGRAPDLVAHTGSTSKALAPGLRLGWLAPPSYLLPDLVTAKHATDLGSPALPQLVLAHLIATGDYDRHLRRVRTRQRARRDALVAALGAALPEAGVLGLAAGLHLVVLLPAPHDDVEVVALLAEAGVVAQPLSWHRSTPGPPGLVLGYAAQTPDRLTEAVRRLAAVLGRRAR